MDQTFYGNQSHKGRDSKVFVYKNFSVKTIGLYLDTLHGISDAKLDLFDILDLLRFMNNEKKNYKGLSLSFIFGLDILSLGFFDFFLGDL